MKLLFCLALFVFGADAKSNLAEAHADFIRVTPSPPLERAFNALEAFASEENFVKSFQVIASTSAEADNLMHGFSGMSYRGLECCMYNINNPYGESFHPEDGKHSVAKFLKSMAKRACKHYANELFVLAETIDNTNFRTLVQRLNVTRYMPSPMAKKFNKLIDLVVDSVETGKVEKRFNRIKNAALAAVLAHQNITAEQRQVMINQFPFLGPLLLPEGDYHSAYKTFGQQLILLLSDHRLVNRITALRALSDLTEYTILYLPTMTNYAQAELDKMIISKSVERDDKISKLARGAHSITPSPKMLLSEPGLVNMLNNIVLGKNVITEMI